MRSYLGTMLHGRPKDDVPSGFAWRRGRGDLGLSLDLVGDKDDRRLQH